MRLQLLSITLIAQLFIFTSESLGQGYCRQNGGFTVNTKAGCAPLTVSVTNTVGAADPSTITYYYGYIKGSNTLSGGTNATSNTYGVAGTRTILQQGFANGTAFFQCEDITVYETGLPTAQYSSCGGGKIKMVLTDDALLNVYDQIEIKWGDGETQIWKKGNDLNLEHIYASTSGTPVISITGQYTTNTACTAGKSLSLPVSFQQTQLASIAIQAVEMRGDGTIRLIYQGLTAIPTSIQYSDNGNTYISSGSRSSGGIQPYDIQGLNKDKVYKLRLSSEDLCGTKLITEPAISSMTLSGNSVDGKNVLTWNKYDNPDGFVEYALLRDGTIIKTFTSINDITYTDEDIECGSFSEYQLVAKIKGITSTSAPVGLKAEISSAKPIEKAYVTVNGDNNVTITADVPGAGPNSTYDLSIERAEAGTATFKKIITLYNDNRYADIDVKTNEKSYCYRLSYQNSCGQKPPATKSICTIFLQKQIVNLSWTPESPILPDKTSYSVLQNGSSGSKDEINVQLNNAYTPPFNSGSDLEYSFQVRANSADGDFSSYSNLVTINRNANVYIPDAFSPNGDGTNDVLEAKATLLQSFNLSVFNRWGHIVFHSNDIAKGWDGTINGTNAPVGSYTYKLKVVDLINQTVEKKGTFMLFR